MYFLLNLIEKYLYLNLFLIILYTFLHTIAQSETDGEFVMSTCDGNIYLLFESKDKIEFKKKIISFSY